MAWIQQHYYDDSTGQNVPVWLDQDTGEWSYTDPNPPAKSASGWVPYAPQWGTGEDSTQDRGITDAASLAASQAGGSWQGPGYENMKNVGVVHSPSTGIDGAIFTDGQGNYFHNGQKLPWDDAQAAGQLGATATAMRQEQEHNDSGLGGAINSFFDQYMPVLILAGAGAAVSFGSLASAGSAAGGEMAATLAAEDAAMGVGAAASGGASLAEAATTYAAGGGLISSGAGAGFADVAMEVAPGVTQAATGVGSDVLASEAALQASAPVVEKSFNATLVDKVSNTTPSLLPDALSNGASASLTTGSKIVDWAAKQVIGSAVKGAVASTIGGGPARAPAVTGGPAAEQKVSFGTFGLLDMPSAFKPVTRTKFQVDKTALENSGIAYTPR